MPRTAVVIECPSLDGVLTDLRWTYASDARRGVPPHVTILVPFVPAEAFDEAVVERLISVIGGFDAFSFTMAETGWFGDTILWVKPEPPERFTELTDAVVRAFPAHLPYGGLHDGAVPHATVGDTGTNAELRDAEKTVRAALPVTASASVITVLQEGTDGTWTRMLTVPLRPPI